MRTGESLVTAILSGSQDYKTMEQIEEHIDNSYDSCRTFLRNDPSELVEDTVLLTPSLRGK